MISVQNYLIVGAVLFVLGAVGFLTRRNFLLMVLSTELMLQGVSVNLVAFSHYHGNMRGQSFTIFLLTVAACEGALGLALIVSLYQEKRTLDVAAWSDLGEPGVIGMEPDELDASVPPISAHDGLPLQAGVDVAEPVAPIIANNLETRTHA